MLNINKNTQRKIISNIKQEITFMHINNNSNLLIIGFLDGGIDIISLINDKSIYMLKLSSSKITSINNFYNNSNISIISSIDSIFLLDTSTK